MGRLFSSSSAPEAEQAADCEERQGARFRYLGLGEGHLVAGRLVGNPQADVRGRIRGIEGKELLLRRFGLGIEADRRSADVVAVGCDLKEHGEEAVRAFRRHLRVYKELVQAVMQWEDISSRWRHKGGRSSQIKSK